MRCRFQHVRLEHSQPFLRLDFKFLLSFPVTVRLARNWGLVGCRFLLSAISVMISYFAEIKMFRVSSYPVLTNRTDSPWIFYFNILGIKEFYKLWIQE